MKIYFDHAATTPLDPEVIDAIVPFMTAHFGNPSSAHWAGKKVKEDLENARSTVANLLGASPSEIYFTSGATEAINLALTGAVRTYEISHVITSRIEHKAVLQTLKALEQAGEVEISYVRLDERGNVDLYHLENLLRESPRTLISLMHANNEIGNLTDIHAVGSLAQRYNAIFHSDTTQTIGKFSFNVATAPIDFLVGSAHKFHGPKGVGFLYINKKHKLAPLLHGGGQESGQRGGTENVTGIIGLAKALEIAYLNLDESRTQISRLKEYFISKLATSGIDGICYNGESRSSDKSVANILNVSLPCLPIGNVVEKLNEAGIAVSGGSACSSQGTSHVIAALPCERGKENVRFSFSKFNTLEEVDQVVDVLKSIYEQVFQNQNNALALA